MTEEEAWQELSDRVDDLIMLADLKHNQRGKVLPRDVVTSETAANAARLKWAALVIPKGLKKASKQGYGRENIVALDQLEPTVLRAVMRDLIIINEINYWARSAES